MATQTCRLSFLTKTEKARQCSNVKTVQTKIRIRKQSCYCSGKWQVNGWNVNTVICPSMKTLLQEITFAGRVRN